MFVEPAKGAVPREEGLLEHNGPVLRMPRTVLSRSGRIRTGDEFVGCMRWNLRTDSSGRFLVCALYV